MIGRICCSFILVSVFVCVCVSLVGYYLFGSRENFSHFILYDYHVHRMGGGGGGGGGGGSSSIFLVFFFFSRDSLNHGLRILIIYSKYNQNRLKLEASRMIILSVKYLIFH
jgi:uncharacterized membrane protein YgcG